MESELPCFICGSRNDSNIACPKCLSERDQTVIYCEKCRPLHVKPSIKSFPQDCYPYEISNDPEKGRILKATRKIRAGEIIFEEAPIFAGPSKSSKPICLVCLNEIGPNTINEVYNVWCEKCDFPMCSPNCAASHVLKPECSIISKQKPKKIISNIEDEDDADSTFVKSESNNIYWNKDIWNIDYQALLPLRCLLAKGGSAYNYLLSFMDHCEERKLTPAWNKDKERVIDQIRINWALGNQFSEEDVFKVEGILDVNTIEYFPCPIDLKQKDENMESNTQAKENRQYHSYGCRGFFPVTSFCSHSCVNNTFHKRKNMNKELEEVYLNHKGEKLEPHEIILETRAKVDIQEGEEITIHYSGGLKGRQMRKRLMNQGWFFDCQCPRCMSGTELGSHMSTLICNLCTHNQRGSDQATVIPRIISNNLDVENEGDENYVCETCNQMYSVECIRDNENRLTNQIESANANSVDELEAIITENEFRVIQEEENIEPLPSESDHNQLKFHKQHFLILIVKWLLINIYGRRPGYLNTQLTDKQLQNKLQYCKDYLNALNIVDAGISHNRGRTLWELYSIQMFILNKSFNIEKSISKDEFKDGLRGLLNILKEVNRCLRHSEKGSQEESIFQFSTKATMQCKETLDLFELIAL